MKASIIKLGKWIIGLFRTHCNTADKLLTQDYRPTYPGSLLQTDQTANGEAVVSFLDGGLGPIHY